MGDSPDFQTPDPKQPRRWVDAADWVDKAEPKLSKQELQELAHERSRICKQRDCAVCAPLREQRRLNKAQRRADAQAELHAKGQPCSRSSCTLPVCVAARDAAPASPPPAESRNEGRQATDANDPQDDPAQIRAREAKRHKVGLPCGSEDCGNQVCVDGFTNERTRRHRARRPCRSATCDNPVCVAGRSTT